MKICRRFPPRTDCGLLSMQCITIRACQSYWTHFIQIWIMKPRPASLDTLFVCCPSGVPHPTLPPPLFGLPRTFDSKLLVLGSECECLGRLPPIPVCVISEGLRCVQSVGEWLESLDLLQYENIFLVNGFDDMRFMVRVPRRGSPWRNGRQTEIRTKPQWQIWAEKCVGGVPERNGVILSWW